MNQKNIKLIKRFCKATGLNYEKIKAVFKTYDHDKKAWMLRDMRAGLGDK